MSVQVIETILRITGSFRVENVASKSRPGKTHKVLLACDCESFRYRRSCRHVWLALGGR